MLEVLLYPQAERDLEGIWRYTQMTWGIEQANAYIDDITNRFQLLAENPLICRERHEYSTAVRIYHHAHHLIVYVFTDSELRVVRILHESMAVDAQLDQGDVGKM